MGNIVAFVDFEIPHLDAEWAPGGTAGGTACALTDSPAPPYGTRWVQIGQSQAWAFFRPGPPITFTPSTYYLHSSYFRIGPAAQWGTLSTNRINNLVAIIDPSSTKQWGVYVNADGELELYDNAHTLLQTSAPISPDTTYRMAVIWQPGESSSSYWWYLTTPGSSPVQIGQGAGGDFDTGDPVMRMWRAGQGGSAIDPSLTVYHGCAYVKEDPGTINGHIGWRWGKTGDYRGVLTGGRPMLNTTNDPDCDEDGNPAPAGDNLLSGTWDLIGDDDDATEIRYKAMGFLGNPVTVGGGVKVAAPASRAVDEIAAVKFTLRARKTGSDTFGFVYGYYDPVADAFTVVNDPAGISSTSYLYDQRTLDRSDFGGDGAEGMQGVIGVTRTGDNHNVFCDAAYVTTLEAVPVLTANPSTGRFGNMWRGKRGRPL